MVATLATSMIDLAFLGCKSKFVLIIYNLDEWLCMVEREAWELF